jgi:hypothetical protein
MIISSAYSVAFINESYEFTEKRNFILIDLLKPEILKDSYRISIIKFN